MKGFFEYLEREDCSLCSTAKGKREELDRKWCYTEREVNKRVKDILEDLDIVNIRDLKDLRLMNKIIKNFTTSGSIMKYGDFPPFECTEDEFLRRFKICLPSIRAKIAELQTFFYEQRKVFADSLESFMKVFKPSFYESKDASFMEVFTPSFYQNRDVSQSLFQKLLKNGLLFAAAAECRKVFTLEPLSDNISRFTREIDELVSIMEAFVYCVEKKGTRRRETKIGERSAAEGRAFWGS